MPRVFFNWIAILVRGCTRIAGFSAPFALTVVLLAGPSTSGHSQQIPNLSPDQLQQLQQQSGQQGQGSGAANQNLLQPMIIQPVAPEFQMPLPQSRLEQIMSARAGATLHQFGYDQLGRGSRVEIPQTGAVQDDYVLGPGDEIVVSLRGQENTTTSALVDRNGQVVLPRLAPISATGRNFGSFRQDLQAAVRRAYVGTDVFATVGRMRQISVLVSGEVNSPGLRLLTGLSSVADALLVSGGAKKTGSLRNIRIQRGGREYTVDLYSVLTDRGSANSMRLADGDRILVPSLGPTVAVSGLVRQPGIYELPALQSSIGVSSLLSLAGGQEVQGRYRLSVLRILSDGQSQLVPLTGKTGSVSDSEVLFVQLGADQATGQATLSGGIGLAGQYATSTGTKLSEMLNAPGALGQSPYTLFGIIVRKDPRTLLRTLVAFTPTAVLSGAEDQQLQTDDIVRPISINEMRLLNFVVNTYLNRLVSDVSTARNPPTSQIGLGQTANVANGNPSVAANATANPNFANTDDTYAQGQMNNSNNTDNQSASNNLGLAEISSAPAEVQRTEITTLLEWATPGSSLARARRAAYLRRTTIANNANQLSNATQLQQRRAPSYPADYDGVAPYDLDLNDSDAMQDLNDSGATQDERIGQNGQSAQIPQTAQNLGGSGRGGQEPAQNYIDQSVGANGFPSNREVQTFGELSRQLGVDPLILINFLIDHRALLDGAVGAPGFYFVGPNVQLNDLVQAAGGTVNWADESGVELTTTAIDGQTGNSRTQRQSLPLRQGTLADYTVRARDQLRFNRAFTDVDAGSVSVQGEVRFSGVYSILRGEHLSSLLMRVGGLTDTAYPAGAIFLRKSAAQSERDSYVRAAQEINEQLVVAMTRIGNDKVDPGTLVSMQIFVNELRNQQALGRISVVADPSILAANPGLDPLLEAGDVIYIPQRPSTISVLGQVMQPGSYTYLPGKSIGDYIDQAGGYSSTADSSQTFVIQPNGSAQKIEKSWLGYDTSVLPPGSAIVVPRDVTPLDLRQVILDVSSIFSQLAVSAASLAVLSKQ